MLVHILGSCRLMLKTKFIWISYIDNYVQLLDLISIPKNVGLGGHLVIIQEYTYYKLNAKLIMYYLILNCKRRGEV
jgi:hypothetical protein